MISKAKNWPGCEDESFAIFETLMRKETETTIVYLSAFYCISIQPRLMHYITCRATEFFTLISVPASRKILGILGSLQISCFFTATVNAWYIFSSSEQNEEKIRLGCSFTHLYDLKMISNDGAIVERRGSRDISIEQKKRLNNAENGHRKCT